MAEEKTFFERQTIKSLGGEVIGGYMVAFGSPVDTDLDGEFFTKDTKFYLDWYDRLPALWSHGLDGSHKKEAVGYIYKRELRPDEGIWAEAQLKKSFLYQDSIQEMIEEGRIGWSSSAQPWHAEVDKNGFIREWPIVEASLTPCPAQPAKTTVFKIPTKHYADTDTLKKAVKDLGLEGYDLEDLVLQYKTGNVDGEADFPITETGFDSRPIQIHNHVHLNTTKEDNFNNIKEKEVMSEVKNNSPEDVKDDSAGVAESSPSVPEAVKQSAESPAYLSDDAFSDMFAERMWARNNKSLTNAQCESAVAQLKAWLAKTYLKTDITEGELKHLRSSKEFQELINSISDGFKESEVNEDAPKGETESLRAELESLKELLNSKVGTGGSSALGMADDPAVMPADKFRVHYDPEYRAKQQFANYGIKELSALAEIYYEAERKGLLKRHWSESRKDALMSALYDSGKDVIPKIKWLLPNPHWKDVDIDEPPVAFVAWEHMYKMDQRKTIKANEVFNTLQVGHGHDWIGTVPQAVLWNTLLTRASIFSQIPKFIMIAESVEQYIDDDIGMPKVVPEWTDTGYDSPFTVIKQRSDNITFKARKIGESIEISREEIEDAMIDPLADALMKMEYSMERGIDWAILNADLYSGNNNALPQHQRTGSSNTDNYGHYGADSSDSGKAKELYNIGFEGLFGRALHRGDNSAGQYAGGDNCIDSMRKARREMNPEYYADRHLLRLVMSPEMSDKLMDLDEFKQAMRNVGKWDAGSGDITIFDGTPIIVSKDMVKRDDKGRLSATASENTDEALLFFRPDRMKAGIRRQMSRALQNWSDDGEKLRLFTTMRFDFQTIPNGGYRKASPDGTIRKPVSVLYGIK